MDQLNIGVTVDATRAVDGLTQVSQSIDKVENSTGRMNAAQVNAARLISSTEAAGRRFIAELKEEADTYGKSREELLKYRAAQLGVAQEASGIINQLKQAHGGEIKQAAGEMGEFSFATAGARRELIVLAHEMSQGNWSRFGGSLMVIAERTNAMSLIFSATGLAIGGVAAGVAAFVAAMVMGAREEKAFNDAIVLTGDYAGTTRGQMETLAHQIAASGEVTVGTAKSIAQQVAASGRIMADAYKPAVEAVVQYARATGKSADDSVKEMVKLFEDPTKGALELNRTMHVLTASQIDYIRTLQDSGREAEAQKQLADDLSAKFSTMNTNMGYLETGWHKLKDAASSAWDAMMGWGKDKTVEQKLADVKEKINLYGAKHNQNMAAFGYDASSDQKELAKLLKEQSDLQKQLSDSNASAKKQAATAAAEQVKSEIDAAYATKTHAGEVAKLRAEIVKYQNQLKANPDKAKELNALISDDRERIAELLKPKTVHHKVNPLDTEAKQVWEQTRTPVEKYSETLVKLDTLLKAGKITWDTYARGVFQASDTLAAAEKKAENPLLKAQAEQAAIVQKLRGNFDASIAAKMRDLEIVPASVKALNDDLDKIGKKANESMAEAHKSYAEGHMDGETYRDTLKQINDEADRQKGLVRDLHAEQDNLNASWEYGSKQGLQAYLDQVQNVAGQAKRAMVDAFKGMEDALVKFTQTGKLDFKSLVQSIMADLTRIQIQQRITGPLARSMNQNDGSLLKTVGSWFNNGTGSGQNLLGDIASVFGFANGGIAAYGRPLALPQFASGGVSNSMAIFGEAGPEAAVPLPDGRRIPVDLRTNGGQAPTTINVNVYGVTDAASFNSSKGQVTAAMVRALQQGRRYT